MPRPASFDRDEALDAVMRTFWAHGFEATSLDRLEKATGLKRQSLYNAFGDKEAMFMAALDRYRAQVGMPLRSLLGHDDPAAAVRAYLEGHLRMLADPCTPAGCLIAGCSSELGPRDDAVGARMRLETAGALEAGAETFRAWQRSGKLKPTADPEQLAALLATVVRGLAVLARSSTDPKLIGRAVDGAVVALTPFLTPGEGAAEE
ncbi:MAG TPA: TetR/AcrR family transcriptional regulator [Allosphingosinicella sp.]|nr:TetR/AcrR family transcriptional regulator [Allosphingosinicella sp.]